MAKKDGVGGTTTGILRRWLRMTSSEKGWAQNDKFGKGVAKNLCSWRGLEGGGSAQLVFSEGLDPASEVFAEMVPRRIPQYNQRDLSLSRPALKLLLAADGIVYVLKHSK